DAIARSHSFRSSRARASGSAWSGFAEERMYATSSASPAAATTCPSRTATAWTTCTASTTLPRRTTTLSGSKTKEPSAGVTRDGGLAPRARRSRQGLPDREGRPGARGPGGTRPRRGAAGRDLHRGIAAPALAPARPAARRRDRPRVGERDPAPRAPIALRAVAGFDAGRGRAAGRGDRRGARARPRPPRAGRRRQADP